MSHSTKAEKGDTSSARLHSSRSWLSLIGYGGRQTFPTNEVDKSSSIASSERPTLSRRSTPRSTNRTGAELDLSERQSSSRSRRSTSRSRVGSLRQSRHTDSVYSYDDYQHLSHYSHYSHHTERDFEDVGEATWSEVCTSCCVRTPREWGILFVGVIGICFFLYFFIFSLELLGSGAKVLTGCTAGSLFSDDLNPIAALMIGIICTVLLQSSSITTSIIVSLVGSGAIAVEPAIYMVMGANIGTSVTCCIVALGQMGDSDQLERAFAGATVHDMFNVLSVIILLPVEAATHYLAALTTLLTRNFQPREGEATQSGFQSIIKPLLHLVIIANKNVIDDIATGAASSCSVYYPVQCAGGVETYATCVVEGRVGLVTCDKHTNACPIFFQNGAEERDDKVSGGACLFLGIMLLIICIFGLVSILQRLLLQTSTRIIYKATNINGYLSMLIGAGITVLVMSSSITTSILTPLVGLNIIRLEQMYPLTLGANIGTTVKALIAAFVADTAEALQVALAHLFFNLSGIAIWYPIPCMRRVPLRLARAMGRATRWWRLFPVLYIAVMFFLLPIILWGISTLFTLDSKGFVVLGSILVILIGLGVMYFFYWWFWKNGQTTTRDCFTRRQRRHEAEMTLPDDMEYIKRKLALLEGRVTAAMNVAQRSLDEGHEGPLAGSTTHTHDAEAMEEGTRPITSSVGNDHNAVQDERVGDRPGTTPQNSLEVVSCN